MINEWILLAFFESKVKGISKLIGIFIFKGLLNPSDSKISLFCLMNLPKLFDITFTSKSFNDVSSLFERFVNNLINFSNLIITFFFFFESYNIRNTCEIKKNEKI